MKRSGGGSSRRRKRATGASEVSRKQQARRPSSSSLTCRRADGWMDKVRCCTYLLVIWVGQTRNRRAAIKTHEERRARSSPAHQSSSCLFLFFFSNSLQTAETLPARPCLDLKILNPKIPHQMFEYMHGVLNKIYLKNILHGWVVNREMNLMSLLNL